MCSSVIQALKRRIFLERSRHHISVSFVYLRRHGLPRSWTPQPPRRLLQQDPAECFDNCQICRFVEEMATSVVRLLTVKDILANTSITPFSTRSAWHELQKSCPFLRLVRRNLAAGTQLNLKETNRRDVKRYLHISGRCDSSRWSACGHRHHTPYWPPGTNCRPTNRLTWPPYRPPFTPSTPHQTPAAPSVRPSVLRSG